MQVLESILILIALLSLAPLLWHYSPPWYKGWLVVVLLSMIWVAARRLRRTREAAKEAKRKRDQSGGRPPSAP